MINRERMTDLFVRLASIDSHSKEEREVAELLARELRELGAEVRSDDAGRAVAGNSGNLIARIGGTQPGAAPLMLCAHMDTVPPGKGVKAVRDDGRIRSDGSTILGGDDKSGLAIIVEVLRSLSERSVPHGDIEVAFTICEEIGLLGAKQLDVGALASRRALVLDSSSASTLVTRGPAADRFEFVIHGLESHAGIAPEQGISAVRVAAEAIAAMPLGRVDPQTTSNVVIAECTPATNVVPNRVAVRGEARSLDTARLDELMAVIRRCFQDAAARAKTVAGETEQRAWLEERCAREYESIDVPDSDPLVQLVIAAGAREDREIRTASIGGGSDANVLQQRGITSVNLGTGMRDIHTVNEWLDLADFYACADIVLRVLQLAAA